MKKLLIIMLMIGMVSGVAAQKIRGNIRGGLAPRPTIVRVVPVYPFYGYGYGNNYRYSPFNSPFYDPFYSFPRNESKPSELELQLEDIRNDYSYKLSNVKHDKSLSKDERKQKVRDLKYEREDAIIEAKKNYYKSDKEQSSDKS